MRRGFSVPIIMIVILLFVFIPISFWYYSNSNQKNVQGASAVAADVPGYVFKISSSANIWDMYEYVCDTYEECSESLKSGQLLKKISGGGGEEGKILISRADLRGKAYLKVFVNSSSMPIFKSDVLANDVDLSIERLQNEDLSSQEAVIITVNPNLSIETLVAKFSN